MAEVSAVSSKLLKPTQSMLKIFAAEQSLNKQEVNLVQRYTYS
jgi:hypothetical protein